MTNTVDIELSAQDKGVLQALTATERAMDKMVRKMDRVEKSSRRASSATKSGFEGANRKLRDFAVGMTGLGSAAAGVLAIAQAIKAEYEGMRRRQEATRRAAFSEDEAFTDLLDNVNDERFIKDPDKLRKMIRKVALDTNTTFAETAAVASSTLSAKGDQSTEVALETSQRALQFTRGNVEKATELSQRTLDIVAETGVDPRAALGSLVNLQGAARITDLQKLGASAVPAIISTMNAGGDDFEQAGELFVTLNTLMKDVDGNLTRTANVNFATALRDYRPGATGEDKDGRFLISKEDRERLAEAKTVTDKIAAIRQSEDLQRDFIGSHGFRAAARIPIQRILQGEAKALEIEASAREQVKPLTNDRIADFQMKLDAKLSGINAQVREGDRAIRANLDAENAADPKRMIEGRVRDLLFSDDLEKSPVANVNLPGWDGYQKTRAWMLFESKQALVGGNPAQQAYDDLVEDRRENMVGNLSERDLAKFDLLIAEMKRLADQYERTNQQSAIAGSRSGGVGAALLNRRAP